MAVATDVEQPQVFELLFLLVAIHHVYNCPFVYPVLLIIREAVPKLTIVQGIVAERDLPLTTAVSTFRMWVKEASVKATCIHEHDIHSFIPSRIHACINLVALFTAKGSWFPNVRENLRKGLVLDGS